MSFTTGYGTEDEIEWQLTQAAAQYTAAPPTAPVAIPGLPAVAGSYPGSYTANWSFSANDGLIIDTVRYNETGVAIAHKVVESMQWRDTRLEFPGGVTVPLARSTAKISEILLLNAPGTRKSAHLDDKGFAWGLVVTYVHTRVADAVTAGLMYTITIKESYLFSEPAADQEPGQVAATVKVFPTLSAWINAAPRAGAPLPATVPTFAADLRLVAAPVITRPADQQRPAAYVVAANAGNVVANLFADSNTRTPGVTTTGGLAPNWDRIFDYAEPELAREISFDAVVSRAATNVTPFTYTIPIKGGTRTLTAAREPGQGEFDNLHINPYVGFDDSASADGKTATNNMVEAPIGADEVFHLHWRWGKGIPALASGHHQAVFRGYSPAGATPGTGNEPNTTDGAPLLPANQTLRIKVTDPTLLPDTAAPVNPATARPLSKTQVGIWYSPKALTPPDRTVTQFFSSGFGLAFRLDSNALSTTGLLDDATWNVTFNYHSLRWEDPGIQRIPTVSTYAGADLSKNRTGLANAAGTVVNKATLPP